MLYDNLVTLCLGFPGNWLPGKWEVNNGTMLVGNCTFAMIFMGKNGHSFCYLCRLICLSSLYILEVMRFFSLNMRPYAT